MNSTNSNNENNTNFNSPLGDGGRIVVLADDITGAAEIAGVCLRYGLKVSFGIDSLPVGDSDVKIIATNSRSATESEAYLIHQSISNAIFKDSNAFVFKKCDSALRGFILTELSALSTASGIYTVILQPSNPMSDRCISNGMYYIGGRKIQETAFSFDPDFPTTDSSVQSILLKRTTMLISQNEINVGEIEKVDQPGVYVPDCSSVGDLVKSCELSTSETLLCGSAAFFEQLLIYKGYKVDLKADVQKNHIEGFLLVSGSTHSGSRDFVEKLKAENYPVCTFPEYLNTEKIIPESIDQWVDELSELWTKNKSLILASSALKIVFPDCSTVLSERMALVVQKLLSKCDIHEICISGGATAYTLLKKLNWELLIPVQELSPGVVKMKLQHADIYLTLKPGSYLWPENIVEQF